MGLRGQRFRRLRDQPHRLHGAAHVLVSDGHRRDVHRPDHPPAVGPGQHAEPRPQGVDAETALLTLMLVDDLLAAGEPAFTHLLGRRGQRLELAGVRPTAAAPRPGRRIRARAGSIRRRSCPPR